jgi:hypothetical protein
MIQIATRRFGLLCIAATANDYRDIHMSWGFTQEGATQRLLRVLDRHIRPGQQADS